jgi:hypothetical protein
MKISPDEFYLSRQLPSMLSDTLVDFESGV